MGAVLLLTMATYIGAGEWLTAGTRVVRVDNLNHDGYYECALADGRRRFFCGPELRAA